MIDELYPLCQPTTPLPAALRAGVAQARRIAAGDRDVLVSARVHTRAGRWVGPRIAETDL